MKRLPLAAALCLCACGSGDAPLVTSDQITADAIPLPLISSPGDADRGAIVFSDRDQGHCVLCHVVSDLSVEFQGNVGPDLSNVGKRLSPGQLRLRIVDYQIVKPGTLMPSYYRTDN
ncbi:MAG: sulfur oxidation c-type cytochrome SoxX [Pseudomonadota bacterium]